MVDDRDGLHVLPTYERLEEELLRRARAAGGAAFGPRLLALRDLDRLLFRAAGLAPIDRTAQRLLVATLAADAGEVTASGEEAVTPPFAAAFIEIWDALRDGGAGLAEVERTAARLAGLAGRRALAIARFGRGYERALAGRRLVDEAGARLLLPARLRTAPLPPPLTASPRLLIDLPIPLSVARARVLATLMSRGVAVNVRLPEVAEASELHPQVLRLQSALLEEGLGDVLVAPPPATGVLAHFHRRLFALGAVAPAESPVEVLAASDTTAEARAVAATVREWLDAGVAPDDVCVAVRDLAADRERLGAALDEAGVRWQTRRGAGLLTAPPARLPLRLLELAERSLPRDGLCDLLASGYVDGGAAGEGDVKFLAPRQIAELLRAAGSRDDRGEGHAGRLAAYAARRLTDTDAASEAARALVAARHLERLLPGLRLPAVATLPDHVAAIDAALAVLGVRARARANEEREAGADPATAVASTAIDRACGEALARDQAALRTLDHVLADLVAAAHRLGLAAVSLPRSRFHALLEALLAAAPLVRRGAQGGAVWLAAASELVGHAVPRLIMASLSDGSFPARRPPEPLLEAADRAAFDDAAGRGVLRARGLDEPLLFALACRSAQERLVLTFAHSDARGAELPRSPFVAAALAALGRAAATPCRQAATPLFAASPTGRLLMRGGFAVAGVDEAGAATGDGLPAALRADPHLGPRFLRLLELAAADRRVGGRLLGAPAKQLASALLRATAASLDERVAWFTSPSQIQQYAECPFRFFAQRLLGLRELDAAADDLDAREGGSLLHDVAAEVFAALRDAGLLPLVGGPRGGRERAVAEAACERTLAAWERRRRTGPAPLWQLHRDSARRAIARLLESELAEPSRFVPAEFEAGFGFGDQPPLLLPSPDGGEFIAVRGRVDRLDRAADGQLAVIDYKSGAVDEQRFPRAGFARTDLQLALYAAWARRRQGATGVDGWYRSLRKRARSRSLAESCRDAEPPLEVERLLELDPRVRREARGGAGLPIAAGALDLAAAGNLADTVWSLHGAQRDGRFDVRPHDPARTCRLCAFATVCRIDRAAASEEAP